MLAGLAKQLQARAVEFRYREPVIEIVNYDPNVNYYIIPWSADPSVPVLYFMVYDDEYHAVVDLDTAARLIKADPDVVPFISHTEHPVSNLPCYFLHPCHTKDLLSELGGPDQYFLWLSGVGSKIGLSL